MIPKQKPVKRRTRRIGQHKVYAYEVTPDRITAFASDLTAGASVTIFSPERIEGLRGLKLHHCVLPNGKQAATVEGGDRRTTVGVAASVPLPADVFKPDARARAIIRGLEYARADLGDAGGAFTLEDVQRLLGVSRQAIMKRVKGGSLLAVAGPSNRRVYPTCQFDKEGRVVWGLKDVLDAHPSRNMWAVLGFLINGQADLDGEKPIDLLHAGRSAEVVAAARRVGEQTA